MRRVSLVSAAATLGLMLSPVAAHATETLSASGLGWGTDWPSAIQAADNTANGNLYDLARSRGETCTNATYSSSLYYIVPGGGGYVFSATATGTCS